MNANTIVKIGLVDDHNLFRKGLVSLINMLAIECSILFEASNGHELQTIIDKDNLPDIILLDVNMPGMDGFETVIWLHKAYPSIKVLVISMVGKENTIVRMLKLGVKGYLSKDVEPDELQEAIVSIMDKGFYYTDFITGKLVHSFQNGVDEFEGTLRFHELKEREREFIKYACSEMTYYEIAGKMFVSPKTIDGYRNAIFEKLQIKNRVGLVMLAIKEGWIKL
ncbi:response regulator transcription factor [uncultured Kordia sp.]|uniref:response regulator transcription factor n=1 Tax=uncultured Kordia sp. TaxID=507699 RepID=UPI0026069FDE|nr:response regulator transcription factor [uncultured Kordia sp.]